MERGWLEQELGAGRSIESIAREVGKSPSTVGYWVNTLGLASSHASRHAARGGVEAGELTAMVAEGLTIQQISARPGIGGTSVRHWLRKHGLSTQRAHGTRVGEGGQSVVVRSCRVHGYTDYIRTNEGQRYRCRRCRAEHVTAHRRRQKRILVAEAGGACVVCGYDRYPGALQFHHVDPTEKSFALSMQGVARSVDKARAEARKCVLLCANCHAEVEAGIATIAT